MLSSPPQEEARIACNQPEDYDANEGANHTSNKIYEIPCALGSAVSCGGGSGCTIHYRSRGDRLSPDEIEVPFPINIQVSPVGNSDVARDKLREPKDAFNGSLGKEESPIRTQSSWSPLDMRRCRKATCEITR